MHGSPSSPLLTSVNVSRFNEPGFEKTEGTPEGDRNSASYNAQVRADTLSHALLPALRSPPPAFKALLVQHFRRKHDDIQAMLREWSAAAGRGKGPGEQLRRAASDCEEALRRYAPSAPTGPVETVSLL